MIEFENPEDDYKIEKKRKRRRTTWKKIEN
jgi:hypothetical protein